MYFETIKCVNGELRYLAYHNHRMNRTRSDVFGCNNNLDIDSFATGLPEEGVFRVKVLYGADFQDLIIEPYVWKPIRSLAIVEADIEYSNKAVDRSDLEYIFNKKDQADDVIIIKSGFITDTTTANLLFYDGQNWFTSNTPLLIGTTRTRLLEQGKIKEIAIQKEGIKKFKKIAIINALRGIEEIERIV